MTQLIDTAKGIEMARKQRDNDIKDLTEQRDAASEEFYEAVEGARQAAEDFERAYTLRRRAIKEAYAEKVSDLTGVDYAPDDGTCW